MDEVVELFRTPRLRGRRIVRDDAERMLEVYGDADAMRYVGDGSAADEDEIDAWISVTLTNYENRGYGMIALESLADAGALGFAGLVHPGDQVLPELKYALHRAYWGRGFATEAARAMLEWGHRAFGLGEIIATIDPDNGASRRVLEKIGMRDRGVRLDVDGLPEHWFSWRP